MLDLLIVGAGAAGIAAARTARELGLTALVLEAKSHVGGRAVTDSTSLGLPFDRGAHWLHSPALNPLAALAATHGARVAGQPYTSRRWAGGDWLAPAAQAALDAAVDAAFARLHEATGGGADGTVTAMADVDAFAAAVFEADFRAKQGVGGADASALDFARYCWEGDDLPVQSGYGALLARLATGLDLRLATPVLGIDTRAVDRVVVTTPRGDVAARSVLVTVSTGVLAAGAIRFAPVLPAWKQAAVDALPMGHCNKVAFRLGAPLPGAGVDTLVLPFFAAGESVEMVVRPGDADLVVVIVNGPQAAALAAEGADALAACALDRLAAVFGSAARRAVSAHAVVDWDGDPWVRGYVAAPPPGAADARAALAQPVGDRLLFAGEAVSGRFMGDLHGAWESGVTAAASAAAMRRGALREGGAASPRA